MRRSHAIVLGLAVAALIVVIAREPIQAGRGWLCAFILVSMAPIGSLALLLIHGFTGGRWGDDLKPVLIPTARCMPLLLLAVLPVLIFRAGILDWRAIGVPEDVRTIYLTPAFFDLRTIVALAVWTGLAIKRVWESQLWSAIGMAVHLLLLSLIPPDWVLTIPPGGVSAAFGFGFGCEQIFAAVGLAALFARQGPEPRANQDLAGIMVTALLASMYFVYMQFLIVWYGNVPDKVRWFTVREGWSAVAFLAFLLAVAVPFLSILNIHVRRSSAALRIVGGCVVAGIGLHLAWMTLPGFGAVTVVPMIVAVCALSAALVSLSTFIPQVRTQ